MSTEKTNPTKSQSDHEDLQAEEVTVRNKGYMKYPKPKILLDPHVKTLVQRKDSQGSSDSAKSESSQGGFKDHVSYESMISEGTSNSSSLASDSATASITRYRDDFDDLKCKMKIFGESLNLCKCIASDFRGKVKFMETRLQALEKRQNVNKTESNYSAIIQKNKELSNKTKEIVKRLQMCASEDEMKEIIGKICRNYLHGAWKTIKPSDLEFSKISGGLSNFLYYVALPDDPNKLGELRDSPDEQNRVIRYTDPADEPRKVLLRIYGQVHGERAMDAIVTESVIFTLLSERKLGPKLYGVFSGGRIEEYIPARSLKTRELAEPALSMKIAEKMAGIHSMDIPLSKEPNWLWKTMTKWLKSIKEDQLGPHSKGKNKQEQEFIQRLRSVEFEKEVDWLRKFISTIESPVVFCHNDMQEGNILWIEDDPDIAQNDDFVSTCVQTSPKSSPEHSHMDINPSLKSASVDNMSMEDVYNQVQSRASKATFIHRNSRSTFMDQHFDDANTSDTIISQLSDSGEPKLVLIDFEYCSYNYRGFDIANHFQEWTYDYTNPEYPFYYELLENSPTLEQKEIFIKEYLKHFNANLTDSKEAATSIDAVNQLLNEVDAFAVASHLFWGLWSIINASKSQIPFGYWEYAVTRIDTYFMLKQEIIKKDKFGYPQKRKICEVDI